MTKSWKRLAMACACSLSLLGGLKAEALSNDEGDSSGAEEAFLAATRTTPASDEDSSPKVPVVVAAPAGTDDTADEASSIVVTIEGAAALYSKDSWNKRYHPHGIFNYGVESLERMPISLRVGETRSFTLRSRFSIDIVLDTDDHASIDTLIEATRGVCRDPARDKCKPGDWLLRVVATTSMGKFEYESAFPIPRPGQKWGEQVSVADLYYTSARDNRRYHIPLGLEVWVSRPH